jgi:sugar lactone lactonase YvrE
VEYARQVAAVAINSRGHIFVLQRAEAGKPQLLEFDERQKFIRGFGADLTVRAHGMRIDAEDNLWICDQGGNALIKLNPQGQVILTLGQRGMLGAWDERAGTRLLFNPTDIAIAPNGDVYIAQGHGRESPPGESRVLRLDRNGKYIAQWGGNVEGPGHFGMVHSIALDPQGNVYLADREDKRIVIYDGNGRFIRTIQMANLVCAFMVTKDNELWMSNGQDGQIEKIDWNGNVLGWSGTGPGDGVGQFGESNFMAMDVKGDIYVGDTVRGRVQKLIKKR